MTAYALYNRHFTEGLSARPEISIPEWCDRHRMIPGRGAAEPGRWRTDRTPYLREIMECLSPGSATQRIVVMKGTQLGFTECGVNWFAYSVVNDPGPMMVVLPNLENCDIHSRTKIQPTIDIMPELKARIRDPRDRDSGNTKLKKEFPGGILLLRGSNSAAGLRHVSIRYLILDEVDEYEPDIKAQGDPCYLAECRTEAFHNRKIYVLSSPGIKGASKIEAEYANSDQRLYHVPCPYCRTPQPLQWDNIVYGHLDHQLQGSVKYRCAHCSELIDEHHKTWMLEQGQWVPGNPGHKVRGYKLSSLYSPSGWYSWTKLVDDYLKAKRENSLSELKSWTNTKLADTWDESAEPQIDRDSLYSRREDYRHVVPMQGLILTAGVDVQDDRLECLVKAWGPLGESWAMDYKVMPGNPGGPKLWQDLDEYLRAPWLHASGAWLKIAKVAVDTGGHHTQEAYDYVRPRGHRGLIAIKGAHLPHKPIIERSRSRKGAGHRLYLIGTYAAKDYIYCRLRAAGLPREEAGLYKPLTDQPQTLTPGLFHYNMSFDEEYFRQLTGEVSERVVSAGLVVRRYKQIYNRVEALDCEVYALAALILILPQNEEHRRSWWEARVAQIAKAAAKDRALVQQTEAQSTDTEPPKEDEQPQKHEQESTKERAPRRWIPQPRGRGWVSKWK